MEATIDDLKPEKIFIHINVVNQVTNYLLTRSGKDKIYLMNHSGGTFIGIQAAAQALDLKSSHYPSHAQNQVFPPLAAEWIQAQ